MEKTSLTSPVKLLACERQDQTVCRKSEVCAMLSGTCAVNLVYL